MLKICWLICFIFIAGLAVAVTGMSPSRAVPQAEANASKGTPDALVAHSSSAESQALWLRLRWLLAGLSMSAILIVVARQLRAVATAPRPVSATTEADTSVRQFDLAGRSAVSGAAEGLTAWD